MTVIDSNGHKWSTPLGLHRKTLRSLRPRADTKRQHLPGVPRQGYVTKYVTKLAELSVPETRDVGAMPGGHAGQFFLKFIFVVTPSSGGADNSSTNWLDLPFRLA